MDRKKAYSLNDAVGTLKKFQPTKFDQTVTVSFRLGVDPKQSDQMVRGTCPLPHGSGKKVRVLVFAEGKAADDAKGAPMRSGPIGSYAKSAAALLSILPVRAITEIDDGYARTFSRNSEPELLDFRRI